MIVQYETEHYIFHCIKDSLAERDIEKISHIQEKCFNKICSTLKIKYPWKISYWFYNSPDVLGRYLCDGNACNGLSITDDDCTDIGTKISLDGSEENAFIVPPYSIHAVYDEQIKCIGEHEDTHVIAAHINEPSSDFLCEGLAMFMDGKWWSNPNKYWVKQFIIEKICPKPSELIDITIDEFWGIETKVSYPLAGAWVEFFINEYGVDCFLSVYSKKTRYIAEIEKVTGDTVTQVDEKFFDWILLC